MVNVQFTATKRVMKTPLWLAVMALLIALSYLLPYTLLRGVSSWAGAFLFWCVVTLLAIGANVLYTRGWKGR